jgi:antitoxin component YwqK of YwqJK toxin-antitoxin module
MFKLISTTNPDSSVTSVGYIGRVRQGKQTVTSHRGIVLVECEFKDGLLTGEYIERYENGVICEKRTYKEGKLIGERIGYDENGNIEYLLGDV